ncbi:unnamed protein product [Brassica rapa]|uniref:Uncharacterized protein n=2 Tax=Brassica TaxID=3705 RepID=A0A8D9LSM6_BRACM|nr:unnamed protein product [Brassica napus]CAG7885338.1 unnamed protein product [Brassica rapa]
MCVDGNDGSCTHRNESPPLPQNYFITNPNATQACADNSSPLIRMMTTCHEAAGKSDGGGAAEAANGRLTCGCDSLSLCKAAPKPAAGGESTRNPSDLPAGHAVST